jgi:fructose-1,6-bisphosphatase/inositol monophosphatase family enzyme
MLDFVRKAGGLAMEFIDNSGPSLKKDQSVLTKADKAISQMARESLADLLMTSDHVLIDEEDPGVAGYLDQEKLEKIPYIWALDPIDGTRLYANRMPLFGVSLGLIKDLKPWLGAVYFPALKELFYCDGNAAYFVQDAFSQSQRVAKITPVDEELTARSLFFCNYTFFDKFYWKEKDFHILVLASAVVNLCWPTVARGAGCFLRCHLWDYAGSWPIFQAAGLGLRRVSDGQVLDRLSADLFTRAPRPWQMKEYYLMSSQRNFSAIRSLTARRSSENI